MEDNSGSWLTDEGRTALKNSRECSGCPVKVNPDGTIYRQDYLTGDWEKLGT